MDIELYRPIIFFATIIICLSWEAISPVLKANYHTRLPVNIVMFISSIIILKICFPFGIYGLAVKLNQAQSIINLKDLHPVISLIATILVFDLAIYWQHRIFHVFKYLWKFHVIHHCDKSMDASTAVRFHPGEILISGLYKIALIMLLNPKAEYFLIYEMILSSMAIFNHSNIKISTRTDYILRFLIVTPSMHTPHHSPDRKFTNSNYGNFLSIWDRVFKSYSPTTNKEFGLNEISLVETKSIKHQLSFPFK